MNHFEPLQKPVIVAMDKIFRKSVVLVNVVFVFLVVVGVGVVKNVYLD